MERIFEYAIIRLVPFAYREEQLNVGLIVFLHSSVDVVIRAPARLVKAFGVEPQTIEWIASYVKSVDDPRKTIKERWAALQVTSGFSLSELGWFSTIEDEQYDRRVEEIVHDYVDRPKFSSPVRKRSSLMKEIRSVFVDYDIFGKNVGDINKHKVVSNTPIGPSGKLHIDFLLKNSFYHATETLDFRGADDAGTAELKDAALAAVTLQYAKEQLGSKLTKCYLVYAAPAIVEKSIEPALLLAQGSADNLFNLESQADRVSYFDYMLDAASKSDLFRN